MYHNNAIRILTGMSPEYGYRLIREANTMYVQETATGSSPKLWPSGELLLRQRSYSIVDMHDSSL